MLRTEQHIIAAMGIDDGGKTDFHQVFRSMGIRDEWILTPGSTPSEIRKAFGTFSKSAVRASQTATSFSQTAAGGFGAP
jgi:Ca2+-binding EF-hand superfamily protein